jgi:hypothetical protein
MCAGAPASLVARGAACSDADDADADADDADAGAGGAGSRWHPARTAARAGRNNPAARAARLIVDMLVITSSIQMELMSVVARREHYIDDAYNDKG